MFPAINPSWLGPSEPFDIAQLPPPPSHVTVQIQRQTPFFDGVNVAVVVTDCTSSPTDLPGLITTFNPKSGVVIVCAPSSLLMTVKSHP